MPTRQVQFTNLEKVFFPKAKFTKGDLIKYYVEVAPYLLPHLKNRPVTLVRFPDGITGERFYEKNVPRFAPAWIKTTDVARKSAPGTTRYIVINDASTLAWCANLAALEFHPFLHRTANLQRPTSVVFDLDPGAGANLLTCIRVALHLKAILDPLGLTALPKVSGSKGLQLYVPLNTPVTYAATSIFAKAVAVLLKQRFPRLVVSEMSKDLRKSKVFIDWSQNGSSKTTVAVYSLRGKRDQPYVSMPVTWPELTKALKGRSEKSLFFSPADALRRLAKRGDLFAPVLTLKQSLPRRFATETEPALQAYRQKRDFAVTAEPPPERKRASARATTARFVIQKHDASHLHYDFRLERDGVLKSWAVPKGLSTEAGVKRAAFEVEDHPLDYMTFEGIIPEGQYGGGTVMVWDLGTYELLAGSQPGSDLKLRLHGKKLQGEWHMFRIRTEEKKPVWLIVKAKPSAKPVTARQDDRSALTQRSMARIARDRDSQWPAKKPRSSRR